MRFSAVSLFFCVSAVFGQTSKGSAPVPTTPTTSIGTQPNSTATTTRTPTTTATPPAEIDRPIFLSGKVMMQDGSPVPQNVTIQRICSGMPHTVAYTDSKGRFSFQWGDRNTAVMSDASDSGPGFRNPSSGSFGNAQSAGGGNGLSADPFGNRMINCELRANLAGFTSDTVSLFNRRATDNPDVGVIVLHRIAGVEGTSISATSMMAPKDARKAYEHGLQAMLKNKPDEAEKDFEKAVTIYPQFAEAWMNLGKTRLEMKSYETARAALAKAVEADPKLVSPYIELGLLSARQSQWKESGEYLDKAVRLDPIDFPNAWYADAVAHFNLGNYEAAEKSAREAVRLDSKHLNPRADYLLGLLLAEKKDYAGAATKIASYLQLAPNAPDSARAREQLAQIRKLIGEASQAQAGPPAANH
jgi:tetratricopeptide (TPR) repeat protein